MPNVGFNFLASIWLVFGCKSKAMTMKKRPETPDPLPKNPNDHKVKTPRTKNKKSSQAFTSYDTSNSETSTPQRVRESRESSRELERQKKAK